jgi:Ca-activated chloride channel homolog
MPVGQIISRRFWSVCLQGIHDINYRYYTEKLTLSYRPSMTEKIDHYARLDLPLNATPEEVRRAYREAARRLHPDINAEPGDTQLFLGIQEAYEILSDPEKRAAYDATLHKDAPNRQLVTINTLYSRSKLPRINEPQLIYVTITLSPAELDESISAPPTNLCLVIDSSTSMQGIWMDMVKSTAVELARQMQPNDILSLVTFNDRAEILVSGGTSEDYNKFSSSIQMILTRGGTEIFQGLKTGVNLVNSHRRKGYINHVILLTDGHTYGDEADCLELANQAASQGIGITTLGIGTRWNDVFLDTIASRTGSASAYIRDPEQVRILLYEAFNGISKSYADNLTYSFDTGPKVDLKYAFRLQPEATPLEIESPLKFGNIPKNGNCSLILEFLIHELPENVSLLNLTKGRLTAELPNQPDALIDYRIDLSREIYTGTTFETPPPAIMQAMSRLTLYRMQEQAQKELAVGQVKEATRRLQHVATHLLSLGESDLALAVLKEVDNLNNTSNLSEEGIKRIKYGTRSLVKPSPG